MIDTQLIDLVEKTFDGVIAAAATHLGIPRTTLYDQYKAACASLGRSPRKSKGEKRANPTTSVTDTTDDEGEIRVIDVTGMPTNPDTMMSDRGIDPNIWRVYDLQCRDWTAPIGNGVVAHMQHTKIALHRIAWASEQVCPVTPVAPLPRKKPLTPKSANSTTLIIPDSQCALWWSTDRAKLYPCHDRRALDIALQIAILTQPDKIILLGDMLDLPSFSRKFLRHPRWKGTTNFVLRELYWWLAQFRLACPYAEIIYIEGNHEKRLPDLIMDRAPELLELRRADATFDDPPAISVPNLLALDNLDVQYIAPLKNGLWLWDGAVHVTHEGPLGKRGGQSVAKALDDATFCSHRVYGHTHKRELAAKLMQEYTGTREVWAMSPGTLARVDGTVAGVSPRVDWQQSVALIHNYDGYIPLPELVPIERGFGYFRQDRIQGDTRVEEIAEAINYAPLCVDEMYDDVGAFEAAFES